MQNWSDGVHFDCEFEFGVFMMGKWIVVFPVRAVFPPHTRERIEQLSPPESEPTFLQFEAEGGALKIREFIQCIYINCEQFDDLIFLRFDDQILFPTDQSGGLMSLPY